MHCINFYGFWVKRKTWLTFLIFDIFFLHLLVVSCDLYKVCILNDSMVRGGLWWLFFLWISDTNHIHTVTLLAVLSVFWGNFILNLSWNTKNITTFNIWLLKYFIYYKQGKRYFFCFMTRDHLMSELKFFSSNFENNILK